MRRCGVASLSFGCIHPYLRLPASTVNVHLVEVDGLRILVDTGAPWTGPVLARMLRDRGWAPEIIAISHAHIDHVGGAHYVQKEFPKAKLLAHAADVETIHSGQVLVPQHITPWTKIRPIVNWAWTLRPMPSARVDGSLESLRRIGITPLPTPGHADPHTSLILPDGQVIAGDAITVGHRGRPQENLYFDDWEVQRESVRLLAERARGLIHPGHGPACHPDDLHRLVLSFGTHSPPRLLKALRG